VKLVGSGEFGQVLGLELVSESPDEVVVRLPWRDDWRRDGGQLHGGVLMALADSAGAHCTFLNLPEGAAGTATIESKTNFFAAVRGGDVRAVARPLHRGRSTVVIETDLFDESGRRVARVTQTQAVLTG
jgi:1,4-dihydroxy-2-naphthoyl-CoA hydrolase